MLACKAAPLAPSAVPGDDEVMLDAQTVAGQLELNHFRGIGFALVLGLLVGVQRGWVQREVRAGSRFAGPRTFALIGVAGGLAGALYASAQGASLVLIAAAAVLILLGYYRGAAPDKVSGTASMVGLITLGCGFLTGSGEMVLGAAVAVAMVLLLAMRSRLHAWVGGLSEDEVLAIARFALISTVILPLLPDRGFGPYEAWNLRQLWLVVVLVSGFSFAGYFATKLLGPTRGTIATAAAGSVVSSTAVTAVLAARMRDATGNLAVLNAAICVASVMMLLRVVALVALLASFALGDLAAMVAPALLASAVPALWYLRQIPDQSEAAVEAMRLRNPFDLVPALLLAALVMATTVAARWVLERYGDAGLATVLAISGAVDVDSAIITLGTLPPGIIEPRIAAAILCVPVILNSVLKAGLAISIAGWRKGWRSALPLGLTAASLALAVLLGRVQ